MGQQQLLLLVLGIVIVGLAVVVGIQAFSENQKKANADALVLDAIRIASDLQAWVMKPEAFGGGGNDLANWATVTFEMLGYEIDGPSCTGSVTAVAGDYCNLNGAFTLGAAANQVTITARSLAGSQGGNNQVVVTVIGTRPEDISSVITELP